MGGLNKRCVECHRAMRGSRDTADSAPGTVRAGSATHCGGCLKRMKREAVRSGVPLPTRPAPTIESRVLRLTDRSGECWLWLGAVNNRGYGQMKIARRSAFAHRASYEVFRGPIPDGLQIDHLCRVRSCVNPEHLEPVTALENIRRAFGFRGLANVCTRGHEFTPENTLIRKDTGGRKCRACRRLRDARAAIR